MRTGLNSCWRVTKKFLVIPPTSVNINNTPVSFSSTVRSLGVTLDQNLSLQQHVTNICRSAYSELRRIGSIRHYLSEDATKILVCAFVLSKIDYCNSLLAGLPQYLLHKLQRIQNNAARLVLRRSKFEHATPLLHSLHWLPISERINYKLSALSFAVITGLAPGYLSDLLHLYTPSRLLRSSSDTRFLQLPLVKTVSYGERTFSFQAPSAWNALPTSLRHIESLSAFKSGLKTHLFSKL